MSWSFLFLFLVVVLPQVMSKASKPSKPKCVFNSQCQRDLACINKRCQDPCADGCGFNTECEVINHVAVCSCNEGFVGDPYTGCSLEDESSSKQSKQECVDNSECQQDLACISKTCNDPCVDECGFNTECEVVNHVAACSCQEGYAGDPFTGCTLEEIESSADAERDEPKENNDYSSYLE